MRLETWAPRLILGPCILAACDSGGEDHAASAALSAFSLAVVERIELEETEESPLGEIGIVTVAGNGDLLVGDRLIPRIRRYDRRGRLVAQFGAYGDGPFEFRRVGGLLEDADGRVLVVDPARSRVTVLGADLVPDTSFQVLPPPAGQVQRLGDGYLMMTTPARRALGIARMDAEWSPLWNQQTAVSGLSVETPYWISYATMQFAAARGVIATAYSFLYPIRLYDLSGAATDTLGEPPPSFREAPVLKPGAFVGPGAEERRNTWLSSFTVIANLATVGDSLLAVTHGVLREVGATRRLYHEHHAVDFYHLDSRVKLAEDIAIPLDTRVMVGGRRGLYAVSAEPPDPWTISVLELRPLK